MKKLRHLLNDLRGQQAESVTLKSLYFRKRIMATNDIFWQRK